MKKKHRLPDGSAERQLIAAADTIHVAIRLLALVERAIVDPDDIEMTEHARHGCGFVLDEIRNQLSTVADRILRSTSTKHGSRSAVAVARPSLRIGVVK